MPHFSEYNFYPHDRGSIFLRKVVTELPDYIRGHIPKGNNDHHRKCEIPRWLPLLNMIRIKIAESI